MGGGGRQCDAAQAFHAALSSGLEQKMRLYLDVCCLNRPFNDRTQERIRLESEAVLSVLSRIELGTATGIYSPMHAIEIANIPDLERRVLVELLSNVLT